MKREKMVKTQIEARGVKDNQVLMALRKVQRHKFVAPEYQDMAYEDHPLPIGQGQTISQPYIVALMSEVLDLGKNKTVLEIGTGCGYQTAILAEICHFVYTIEVIESLARRGKETLIAMGYKNAKVKIGDGYKGWPEYSPFDAILVTCAPSHIPKPLTEQLAENGKMVIPVGHLFSQELILLTKKKHGITQEYITPVRFVPMIGKDGSEY